MNSAQAVDLKLISGGNCDQIISQCLFDSAGFARSIDLGISNAISRLRSST